MSGLRLMIRKVYNQSWVTVRCISVRHHIPVWNISHVVKDWSLRCGGIGLSQERVYITDANLNAHPKVKVKVLKLN
jgi:hypothetical protein